MGTVILARSVRANITVDWFCGHVCVSVQVWCDIVSWLIEVVIRMREIYLCLLLWTMAV